MTLDQIQTLRTANLGLPLGWEAVYIEENGHKVMRYLNGNVLQQERPAEIPVRSGWRKYFNHPAGEYWDTLTIGTPSELGLDAWKADALERRDRMAKARDAEILQGLERRLAE